jgi:hypothetical protein
MSTPPPCFAPRGFYCSDVRALEECPESWYCRGGLLLPSKCPDAKWAAAGSAYLSDCGNRMETDIAVLVAIIIVFLGLSLCMWAYCDWAQMCGWRYPGGPGRDACYDPASTRVVLFDPAACDPPGRSCRQMAHRPQARYILIPSNAPPV